MKTLIVVLSMVCTLGMMTGCHSGTIRGAGSDVEKLGEHMQK